METTKLLYMLSHIYHALVNALTQQAVVCSLPKDNLHFYPKPLCSLFKNIRPAFSPFLSCIINDSSIGLFPPACILPVSEKKLSASSKTLRSTHLESTCSNYLSDLKKKNSSGLEKQPTSHRKNLLVW